MPIFIRRSDSYWISRRAEKPIRLVVVAVFWVLLGAIAGAVSVACVMFLYFAYKLSEAGVSADTVPLYILVVEVMELDRFARYGAIGGAAIGLASLLPSALRWLVARSEGRDDLGEDEHDPDTMIRNYWQQRADAYLASRKQATSASSGKAEPQAK